MAYCPECNGKVDESATQCSHCGKQVIPADQLENVPVKTTAGQKIFIAIAIVLLIVIGLTFQSAGQREDEAAQINFRGEAAQIVKSYARHQGLAAQFGLPICYLSARTKSAVMRLEFPRSGISKSQASVFARDVCTAMARDYVNKGYIPRHLEVIITAKMPNGDVNMIGRAVLNGNTGKLRWQNR